MQNFYVEIMTLYIVGVDGRHPFSVFQFVKGDGASWFQDIT
jgi:hypothetical protein